MLADEFAGIDDVAAALGRSPDWLRRNWLKIHREDGFPRKHPTGWTWPRAAIAAWARSAAPPEAADTLLTNPDAAWQAALDHRYGAQS